MQCICIGTQWPRGIRVRHALYFILFVVICYHVFSLAFWKHCNGRANRARNLAQQFLAEEFRILKLERSPHFESHHGSVTIDTWVCFTLTTRADAVPALQALGFVRLHRTVSVCAIILEEINPQYWGHGRARSNQTATQNYQSGVGFKSSSRLRHATLGSSGVSARAFSSLEVMFTAPASHCPHGRRSRTLGTFLWNLSRSTKSFSDAQTCA